MAATCHGDGTCKGVSEAISGARELRGHDLDYQFFWGGESKNRNLWQFGGRLPLQKCIPWVGDSS